MALSNQVGPTIPSGYRGQLKLGDEQYLWILVFVEVGILGGFRWATRKLHGG